MPDISMTVDETLELDEIIQEWSRTDSNIDLNGDKSSFDISGIQTKTSILEPQETGNYTITINGQDLSVEVTGSNTIPDSVAERDPDDNSFSNQTDRDGVWFTVDVEWPDKIGAEISGNTGTVTNAYIYNVDTDTLLESTSFASKSVGDTITISLGSPLQTGTNYTFVVDNGGNGYDVGYNDDSSPPYPSPDGNITIEGQGANGSGTFDSPPRCLLKIGNVGF